MKPVVACAYHQKLDTYAAKSPALLGTGIFFLQLSSLTFALMPTSQPLSPGE